MMLLMMILIGERGIIHKMKTRLNSGDMTINLMRSPCTTRSFILFEVCDVLFPFYDLEIVMSLVKL